MTTPFDQYGLTPEQVQEAVARSGGTFQLPQPALGAGSPGAPAVNTFQPLSPEEQQLGQAFGAQARSDQQAAAEADAMRSFTTGGQAHGGGTMPGSSLPGVDFQPPQTQLRPPTVNPYAPDASQGQGGPGAAAPMPAYPQLRMGGGGGLRNPLPGIGRDARARAGEAQQGFDAAQTDYSMGVDQQRQAIQDQGQAQSEAAQRVAGIERQSGFASAQQEEVTRARMKAYEAATQKTHQQMQALTDELENSEPKDRRAGWQKALGAVAIMLGGIGQGFIRAGGGDARNAGLDAVEASIQRDLEQQRERLANKRTALGAKQSELGFAREQFGATQQAEQAAYLMKLESYQKDIQAAKNQGLSKEALAAANSLEGSLAEKSAAMRLQLHGNLLQQNTQTADQAAIALYQQQQAARAAAQSGGKVDWGKLTPAQLERLNAQGQLPAEGVSVLNQVRKSTAEADGGGVRKLSEGQAKQDAVVAGGIDAYKRLSSLVRDPQGRDLEPGKVDMPAYGVTRGTYMPGVVVPESHLQYAADMRKVVGSILRVESGSAISSDEVDNKISALGLDSSDETVRARGVQSLLRDYAALDITGRLQNADEQTKAQAVVRPGAAR